VNFYKHHIGDYAKKTAHLSALEHGVYLLMLHTYYGTEKPLPTGEPLYRIARAHSKAERAAVDSVAAQFWKRTETGLVNGRAFEEMESATQLVEVARQNGNRGGRPKGTRRVSENNPAGSFSKPSGKAIQTPDSTIQTPVGERSGEDSEKDTEPLRVPLRIKIPIPPDLSLTDAMRQQALTKFPDADADEMFTQFRAHHESHGKAMKSWPAAWVTWIGNAERFGYPKRRTTERKWD
jgi:uncharacterized protein YdaU (DUF1376 family)